MSQLGISDAHLCFFRRYNFSRLFLHLQFFFLWPKKQLIFKPGQRFGCPMSVISIYWIFVNLPCYSHEMKGSLPPFYFVDFKAYKIFTYLHQFKAFTKELFFFSKKIDFERIWWMIMQILKKSLKTLWNFRLWPRVSVQGVKSLGGHFACLCQGFEFYEVKKNCYYFSKRKWKYFYTFDHFYSEKSSKT